MPDVALIALVYSRRRLERTSEVIRVLSNGRWLDRMVVVINGDAIGEREVAPFGRLAGDLTVLGHDNTGREFGAYQAGLDALAGTLPERLVVLNDTVGTHSHLGGGWLEAFRRLVGHGPSDSFAAGIIDTSERRLGLDGRTGSRWIRSNLFGLDRKALEAIACRLRDPLIEDQVVATADIGSFFGPAVDGAMRRHISDFLFSTAGNHWYGARPLDASNCAELAGKARSILQEMALSMRLEDAGVALREPVPDLLGRWRDRIGRKLFRARPGA